MLIICDRLLIGDSFCTLPFIRDISQTANEQVYLLFRHDNVYDLMPKKYSQKIKRLNSLDQIWQMIPNISEQEIIKLDLNTCFFKYQHVHMAESYYHMFDRTPSENPLPLIIEFDPSLANGYPEYDFIISPYSWSDINNNKLWPYNRWQTVIDHFTQKGMKIAVLGAGENPKVFQHVDYIFNKPLQEVAAVISKVKCAALSIDNGIGHIISAVGVPHVFLYPLCLHPNWVANRNTNVTTIRNNPLEITVKEVILAIEKYC